MCLQGKHINCIIIPSPHHTPSNKTQKDSKDGGCPLRERTVVHTFISCSPALLFHSIISKAELLFRHYIYLCHFLLTCLNILLFLIDSILTLIAGDRQPFRLHYTVQPYFLLSHFVNVLILKWGCLQQFPGSFWPWLEFSFYFLSAQDTAQF